MEDLPPRFGTGFPRITLWIDHMCLGPGHDDLHCFRVSGASTRIYLHVDIGQVAWNGMDAV